MKYISFYKQLSILLLIISHLSLNAMDQQQHNNEQPVYESDEFVCCAGLVTGCLSGIGTSAVIFLTGIGTVCCGVPGSIGVPAALGSAGAGACIGGTCGFHVGSCCCTNRGYAQVKKWFSNPLTYARNNQN
jgi:hypothetical protein